MITPNNAVVEVPLIEQVQFFVSHQPPVFGVVLGYAAICLLLFWVTRSKSYLISFLASWLYIVPLWMH